MQDALAAMNIMRDKYKAFPVGLFLYEWCYF